MPTNRLVEIPSIPPRTRGRSDAREQERAQIRDLLRRAGEGGKVIELALDPDERDETVKMQYRAVAREIGARLRFQTARHRPYLNRAGREGHEAALMHVFVTPPEPVPPTRRPRRRKVPTGS